MAAADRAGTARSGLPALNAESFHNAIFSNHPVSSRRVHCERGAAASGLSPHRPSIEDSLRYEKSAGETFSVTRLAYLVTGFSLTTATGDSLVIPDTTGFIPTRGGTVSLPDLPEEKITSITFHIGSDEKTNHSDPATFTANHPLNPNLNNLHWDWQGGYIFLALEGHWRAPGEKLPGGYAYHFARDPNRTAITLPVDLNLHNETRVSIALDPGKLLTEISFAKEGTTTHSQEGDPVAVSLKANLHSFHCHGGALFTDHSFHNNGLTTTNDVGLERTTGKPSDRYKFSTPSLRNIALTAPYMHDGRFATLEEVIGHYNSPVPLSEISIPIWPSIRRALGWRRRMWRHLSLS